MDYLTANEISKKINVAAWVHAVSGSSGILAPIPLMVFDIRVGLWIAIGIFIASAIVFHISDDVFIKYNEMYEKNRELRQWFRPMKSEHKRVSTGILRGVLEIQGKIS